MSMYTLLRNNPTPSEEEIEAAFEGEKQVANISTTYISTFSLQAKICTADLFRESAHRSGPYIIDRPAAFSCLFLSAGWYVDS